MYKKPYPSKKEKVASKPSNFRKYFMAQLSNHPELTRARPDWAYEHMGQDRTPKFAGQVLPDRTEFGLIFYLPSTGCQFS